MLSYLHGFHAGNAADVLKHSLLIFCLSYLKKKEKPLLCVDTHAGAGFYDLAGQKAPNREWENGLGLLLRQTEKPPEMIGAYLKLCGTTTADTDTTQRRQYPGSPAIMAKLLTKGDRLVCFELHPRQAELLAANLAAPASGIRAGPTVEVRQQDGLAGLKSLLPPPSRRGLILIDPSWEQASEYENVPRAVQSSLKRFPEGTFIVWYPLLSQCKKPNDKAAAGNVFGAAALADSLFALPTGKCCRVELYTQAKAVHSPRGMYGSGVVIFNPPWPLRAACEEALPYLAKTLGGNADGWRLDWK